MRVSGVSCTPLWLEGVMSSLFMCLLGVLGGAEWTDLTTLAIGVSVRDR